jgi:hypothetical protein
MAEGSAHRGGRGASGAALHVIGPVRHRLRQMYQDGRLMHYAVLLAFDVSRFRKDSHIPTAHLTLVRMVSPDGLSQCSGPINAELVLHGRHGGAK